MDLPGDAGGCLEERKVSGNSVALGQVLDLLVEFLVLFGDFRALL